MIVIVEGGLRTGKTFLLTMFGLFAFNAGMKMIANYPVRFPLTADAVTDTFVPTMENHLIPEARERIKDELNGVVPAKVEWWDLDYEANHALGWELVKRFKLSDLIDFDDGTVKVDLRNTAILGHEFYTMLESRAGGGSAVGLGSSYFVLQSGKRGNSLFVDSQDFDALDKRLRIVSNLRVWSLGGDSVFTYGVMDRSTQEVSIRRFPKVVLIPMLGPCYSTFEYAKSERLGRSRR